MLLLVFGVEGAVALALVLAVPLAFLLLEQVVVIGAVVFDCAHARMMPGNRRYNRLEAAQGRGAIGSAPVSKTGGCRFESCRPCSKL